MIIAKGLGRIALVALAAGVIAPARADISGFASFAPVNASGHAAATGLSDDKAVLTLSDGGADEATSAFAASPQPVSGFHAAFTYQADKLGGPSPGGADGAVFILQNDPRGVKALGGQGGGMGYAAGDGGVAVSRSVAFRLTLYGASGVSVSTDGAAESPGDTLPVDLRSGHPVRVTLEYDGATLTETLKDLTTGETFTGQDDLNVAGAVGPTALVGFSGASGAATARQTIRDFSFVSKPATAKFVPPAPQAPKLHKTLTSYVNPMIGTDGGGDTLPGAGAPFGMTLFSPDTHAPSVGYGYGDHRIEGFSLTHMSGVGCDDEGDVFLTATTGPIKTQAADYLSPFSHKRELASAGYYSVNLRRWNVDAELTATERTGLVRFTFPAGQPANILLPLSHTLTRTERADLHFVGPETVEGSVRSQAFCGAGQFYTTYFTLKLDRPVQTSGTFTGDSVTAGSGTARQEGPKAPPIGAYLSFPASEKPFTVTARIGISYVDLDGARRNLAQEVGGRSFDQVRKATEASWEKELHRIEITGGTTEQRTVFYTSLYHCFLMPSVFSDVDGRYLGFDNAVHQTKPGHPVYADYSGWDIYRTEAPLLTLIEPQRMQDMCQSISLMYQQGGWIDRWPQANVYTNVMCGSPLTTVAATAWNAGLHGFDMAALYPGMVKDATQPAPPGKPYQGEAHVQYMDTVGYIPDDKEGYGSVSQTEEDCLAYAALASVSASLGKTADARFLYPDAPCSIATCSTRKPSSCGQSWLGRLLVRAVRPDERTRLCRGHRLALSLAGDAGHGGPDRPVRRRRPVQRRIGQVLRLRAPDLDRPVLQSLQRDGLAGTLPVRLLRCSVEDPGASP